MKKAIFLVAISLLTGYFSYPLLNPPATKENDEMVKLFREFFQREAMSFTEAKTAEQKLKAADAMYEKMMLLFLSQLSLKAPENKPIPAVGPIVIVKQGGEIIKIPAPVAEKKSEPKTIAEKILAHQLDLRTYLTFSGIPFLNALDARVERLKGQSKGKLNYAFESRTGSEETAVLIVGEETKFTAKDTYDNVSINYSGRSSETFQSVPGDENLLMIRMQENRFIILNLKNFPELTGKVFSLNRHIADFILKKVK